MALLLSCCSVHRKSFVSFTRERKVGLTTLFFLLRPDGVSPHGHVNGRLQFVPMKRLQDEAVVFRPDGPLHGERVGIGGHIDNRYIHLLADLFRGLHTVLPALQAYVHQNQVGIFSDCDGDALLGSVDRGDYRETKVRQALRQFFGNQNLVFNDQYARLRRNRVSVPDDPP